MSIKYDDSDWEYWLRLDSWSSLGAAFLLDGTIPSGYFMNEMEIQWEQGFFLEPTCQTIWDLIRKNYSESDKVFPQQYLTWATEMSREDFRRFILNKTTCISARSCA